MTSAPRRRIFEKLGFQIAFLLAAALLPLTLVSMANSARVVQEMRARSEAALTGETMQAAAHEIRLIHEARGSSAAIAHMIGPLLKDDVACSAAMHAFVKDHPVYAQASFVPADGQLRCSSLGKKLDLSESQDFQDILSEARPGFTVNRVGMISGKSVLVVTHPVVDRAGQNLGFVALSLPHSQIEVVAEAGSRGEPLELLTFDRDGEILAATVGLENAAAALPRDRLLQDLTAERPFAFSAQSQAGESRVFSIVPLVPGELFALGSWPADPKSGISATLYSVPSFAPAVIWIASLVVAWFSVEWLVNRHIRLLNRSINEFTGGNRAATDIPVTGAPLEIREMAASFERMTDAVMRDEAELEDTLHQKEVLMREVHHRVKNNLQMIASILNMHGRKARTPEARQIIRGLQSRIMSLATIHRELYQTTGLGEVNAAELLDAISRQTSNASSGATSRIDLSLNVEDIPITPDQAVPLALLVGEGLMSAMASEVAPDLERRLLKVTLSRSSPENVVLRIERSKPATRLPDPQQADESIQFSLQLMSIFSQQLGGKLEFHQTDGDFALCVVFPLRAQVEEEDRHPDTRMD